MPQITRATGEPRDHHRPGGGFRNPWTVQTDAVSPLRAARWLATRSLAATKTGQTPRVAVEALGAGARMMWLGRASVSMQTPDEAILVDPVFSDRVSPLAFAGPERLVAFPADLPLGEPPVRLEDDAARRGIAGRVHVLPVGGQLGVHAESDV